MDMRVQTFSWSQANQACLEAEFMRLKKLLGANPDSQTERPGSMVAAAMENPPAIDRLAELFGLSAFERDIVLLCAGVEMESRLASLCAEAQVFGPAYGLRACPTFGLAMATLPEPHWSALRQAARYGAFIL